LDDANLRNSVVELEQEAGRLGITGVPFFIIDEAWAVSGAQPAQAWLEVLQRIRNSSPEVATG
jgi:predicted DsbA family dithiol-disulfide isomerase